MAPKEARKANGVERAAPLEGGAGERSERRQVCVRMRFCLLGSWSGWYAEFAQSRTQCGGDICTYKKVEGRDRQKGEIGMIRS